MSNLRNKLVRMAYHKKELRPHLLPLVREAGLFSDKFKPSTFDQLFKTFPFTAVGILKRWTRLDWNVANFETGVESNDEYWALFQLRPKQKAFESRLEAIEVYLSADLHADDAYSVMVTGHYAHGPEGYGPLPWFDDTFDTRESIPSAVEKSLGFAKKHGIEITWMEASRKV